MAEKAKKTGKKKRKKKARKRVPSKSDNAKKAPTAKSKQKKTKIKAKKKKLKRQLLELEIEEKKLQAESATKEAAEKITGTQTYLKYSSLPEPVKYFLLFLVLSIITVVAGMLLFSIALALGGNTENEVTVLPTTNPTTTTTTTTHSTTTYTTTTSSTTQTTTTTVPQIVCTPPYMRFGLGCCLDKDDNKICDQDEVAETTTTSTTLADYVRCNDDMECGPTRVEYTCKDGDVHRVTVTHFCRNPGTRASVCETNLAEEMVDPCGPTQQCIEGRTKCKNKYAPSNFIQSTV